MAVDLRELQRPGTGIGRWISNFLEQKARLAPGVEIVGVGSYHSRVDIALPWPGALQGPRALRRMIERERIGLWLSPYFKIPSGLPVDAISTVHDTIPATILHRKLSFTFRLRRSLARAAMVATVSEESRRDLIENWNVPPEKVIMARNSVGRFFTPGNFQMDAKVLEGRGLKSRNYILVVADDRPHKNLATLVTAFAHRDILPIAVVGTKKTDLPAPFMRVGVVDDPTLAILYRHAAFLLHPALAEGFGLPVLEAMASGTAVILSDIPVMREIAGDRARYVPALDVEAWRRAVAKPPSAEGVIEAAARFRGERTYADLWSEISRRLEAR